MNISVAPTLRGLHVTTRRAGRNRFADAVQQLKQATPSHTRLFQPALGYWFIDRRSERHLRRWLEAAGATDV